MNKGSSIVGATLLAVFASVPFVETTQAAGLERLGALMQDTNARRPRTRIEVRPGRLLYRDCKAWLAQEWRPSGTVIVPRERCWWVRG